MATADKVEESIHELPLARVSEKTIHAWCSHLHIPIGKHQFPSNPHITCVHIFKELSAMLLGCGIIVHAAVSNFKLACQ